MDLIPAYSLLAFGALFAVLNPFATLPPFLAMTSQNEPPERRRMARRACSVACGVLIVFALSGMTLLNFFGVSVAAFRIAGGLILIRVAFELIQGSRSLKISPEERREGVEKDDISITPLGIPILCGPATITTAILLSSQAVSWLQTGTLLLIIALIYAGILVLLRLASDHSDMLGETAIRISSRLMGLILVAVAVQFVVDGIRDADLVAPLGS
jgi:multiple antibiotic resistance protein